MFLCIGVNNSETYSMGSGETIEEAISNWSTLSGNWGSIIEEFNRYDPVVVQGQKIDVELECPPPIIKIL